MEGYRSTTKTQAPSSPPRGHVGFSISNKEAKKEEKTKYLTARYGQHQMMLIRKRLAVEDWLYDELRELYNCEVRLQKRAVMYTYFIVCFDINTSCYE